MAAAAGRVGRQPNPDPNAPYRGGLPAGVVLTRRRPSRARGGARFPVFCFFGRFDCFYRFFGPFSGFTPIIPWLN